MTREELEKKSWDMVNQMTKLKGHYERIAAYWGYRNGYTQALEDNKDRKYTEEDVIRIVEKSRETGLTAEYLIMTFQSKTEWEVEFVDGKLKLI